MGDMDVDMDIDLVVDEEEDEELAQLRARAEAARAQTIQEPTFDATTMAVEDDREEGEVVKNDTTPKKIFIDGLDLLNTNDIRNFVGDHYTLEDFRRVEWINDSSANLTFHTNEAALAAFQALSAEGDTFNGETLQAKQLATNPNVELRMRWATETDVKQAGAKDRSRFYLFNPEYDPDLRPRNNKRRPRREERDHSFKRPRRDGSIHSRRSSLEDQPFDVDLYDDDGGQKIKSQHEKQSRAPRRQTDLFAVKDQGRLRDRSASPVSDGDGRYGFEEKHPYRRTARRRSESPKDRRNARSPRRGQELFSNHANSANGHAKLNSGKELFPNSKTQAGNSRNMHPNHVADLMSRTTFPDGRDGVEPNTASQKRDLFSRITGGPGLNTAKELTFSSRSGGRLNADDHDREGFSILGASKEVETNTHIRELFPLKATVKNNGQDLFAGRTKGRPTQRRRAEDLF